jgi:TRAP transporter TatT component family protein
MIRLRVACMVLLASTLPVLAACDMGKLTVNTTSKVLLRAQPALKMESDYELASRAMPGTIKTIEGFWVVNPDNGTLTALLAEAYCQYGTGFVEDEWERAVLEKRRDDADYHSRRATRMFVRCTNYGLKMLGGNWGEKLYGDLDTIRKMIADADEDQRDGLMWTAVGLASTINQNKDNMSIVSSLPVAKAMLDRVVALDDKMNNKNLTKRAMPHIALGMFYSSTAPALGGDPKKAEVEFLRALEITDNKFLLARVLYAKQVGVQTQNKELFQKQLVEVLKTSPAIWPEERLANEIAHRRALRYLKYEKEWF